MGGPLPPLQRHLAVNIVPGGSGMGPWHSTISPLRAGVAFVDNLKKKIQSDIRDHPAHIEHSLEDHTNRSRQIFFISL